MDTVDEIVLILICAGAVLMIVDVIRYGYFLKKTNNVLIGSQRQLVFWKNLAWVLLFFFLLGYIFIALSGEADMVVAGVLFGGAVFVAIVNRLMLELAKSAQSNAIATAQMLIRIVELRDPNLNGHSIHVQTLTDLIYKYLPKKYQTQINPVSLSYAALIHDIGKIGVPEAVLNKPGKLDAEEWKQMKNHPAYGAEIISRVHALRPIADWVKYHHERIDGKGYYGVPGDEIPLASRIIAVADTYSAITMKRTYKDARSYDVAIGILEDVKGSQLDEDIVNIFVKIPKELVIECQPVSLEFVDSKSPKFKLIANA